MDGFMTRMIPKCVKKEMSLYPVANPASPGLQWFIMSAIHLQLADWGEWASAMLPWVLIFLVAWFFIFRQMRLSRRSRCRQIPVGVERSWTHPTFPAL